MRIPWDKRIYALYKGDTFITEGTIYEISKETSKTIDFLKYMTYPVYKKRSENSTNKLQLILIDDVD